MRFASGPHLGRATLRRLVVPITAVATIAAVVIGAYYAFAPRTQAASAPNYSGRAGLIPQAGSATPSQTSAAASPVLQPRGAGALSQRWRSLLAICRSSALAAI